MKPYARTGRKEQYYTSDQDEFQVFDQGGRGMVKVGIVGATGLVGDKMISVLQESSLSISELRLFASAKSTGRTINFRGLPHAVEIIQNDSWEKGMIILGATSSETARQWIPDALNAGAYIIDNSSAYRMDRDVPLVVPEINRGAIKSHHRLIANPNCSTIQLVMALGPLRSIAPFEWVSVTTYQSVSGSGRDGIAALNRQEEKSPEVGSFHRNIICEIGSTEPSGYTGEEIKLVMETPKILEVNFPVFPACARVPVVTGHTESVTIKFSKNVTAGKVRQRLEEASGVQVSDLGCQPVAVEGTNHTVVGRIRNHPMDQSVIQFWVTADNVRKGAALNAVQILELLVAQQTTGPA
ncbi:MAG: aspartate-semialdehyde dehydrogenase [Candidatus Sabulitectum sp.]|nr:aspartate-semialdehyde dehydrogenase [Candidatus Sabulitectum sp.]